jgi:hypothetical protein
MSTVESDSLDEKNTCACFHIKCNIFFFLNFHFLIDSACLFVHLVVNRNWLSWISNTHITDSKLLTCSSRLKLEENVKPATDLVNSVGTPKMSTCCAYITLKFVLTCWPFQLIFSCLFCVRCFCLSIPSPPPSQNWIVLVCRSKLAYFTPTNNSWFLSWKFISCSTVWATLQLVIVKINDEVVK